MYCRVVDGIEDNGRMFHFNVEQSGAKGDVGGQAEGNWTAGELTFSSQQCP